MKINFQHFKIYTSVSHKTNQTVDFREMFADTIYKNVGGIRAHALAMKIYQSENEMDYSSDEVRLIKKVAEQLCLPGFIDGLNEQLDVNNDTKMEE